jgi:multidrug efflux system outer membrane protein
MRTRTLVSLALGIAVSACSFVPTYQRPAAPVAEQFPGARPGPAGNPPLPASEIGWRSFFADESLASLIELGLANNRDLRIAALSIERARATLQIQRAELLPVLNATAQHARQRVAGATTPSGTGYTTDYYQAGLASTAFEIDFFGRIRALSEASLAAYLATEEARRSVHIALVASIANAWLAVLADEALLQLARETLASREASAALVRVRVAGGVAPESELAQAQVLLETARVALAQLTRSRALDENALALLVGSPLPEGLLGKAANRARPVFAEVPAGLPSDLLIRRPDVRGAEQSLIAANANIGAARAAFFPRIALTGTVGLASGELSGLVSSGARAWTLIPALSLPIFDGGRNQANLDSSLANREIAVAQYEKTIQIAFREVADSLTGAATLDDQLNALKAQVQAEESRLRLSDLRHRAGVSSSLEVLDAQRSLFAARQLLIQTGFAALQNQVTLYKTLGGGWKR